MVATKSAIVSRMSGCVLLRIRTASLTVPRKLTVRVVNVTPVYANMLAAPLHTAPRPINSRGIRFFSGTARRNGSLGEIVGSREEMC